MAIPKSGINITRWSLVGMEAMWCKMFDPPTDSRPTPDQLNPTNPVPEVMAAAGFQNPPSKPHTVQRGLLHGGTLPTWDGLKQLKFFMMGDSDNPVAAGGTYPGPNVRVPRGAIYHCETSGFGPPPHTIHWHGIEPTPMNDGVGHCSLEIGHYTYKWQANFIGFYFYHCHRNTMQHFEFGLYGALLIEPPDAYFATQVLGSTVAPIGHCRDGKRRTAANLTNFPQFHGTNNDKFNGNPLDFPDPWTGDPRLKFTTDPHAMTVAYDVEALWVLDDRDSVWSDLAGDARATFPKHGTIPGVNDQFTQNPGTNGFFAFNDFSADYWFVTGVAVPAHKGGTAAIPPVTVIPPELNSGITGTQVSINAQTGDTILVRCLDAAYNSTRITFPVDIVVIAWDGRALGQPPFGHNEAYLVPAGTPINTSTARRFDALIRETSPFQGNVQVEFIDTRGQNVQGFEQVMVTALIPINIGGTPITPPTFNVTGKVLTLAGAPLAGVSLDVNPLTLGGTTGPQTVVSDASGNYAAQLPNGTYSVTPSLAGFSFSPASANLVVNNQNVTVPNFAASIVLSAIAGKVTLNGAALAGVSVNVAPQSAGGSTAQTVVTDAAGNYSLAGRVNGTYVITPTLAGFVFAPVNTTVTVNSQDVTGQNFAASIAVGEVVLSANKPSPQPVGIPGGITFLATVQGQSSTPLEFEFSLTDGLVTTKKQDFSSSATWNWDMSDAHPGGSYSILVKVRQAGVTLLGAVKTASLAFGCSSGPATYTPGSYTLPEALDSLKMAIGAKTPTAAELARFDVGPLINGVAQPDGKIDLRDVIAILRMVVGLPL